MARSLLPHGDKLPGSRSNDGTANEVDLIKDKSTFKDCSLNERFDSVHLDSPCSIEHIMSDEQQRYPKRKRQEVSYYNSDDESEIWDGSSNEVSDGEELISKKPKIRKAQTQNSKPLSKNQIFPFMELPPELRNRIYQFALTDPKGHYIVAERRFNRRIGTRVPLNTFKITHPGKYEKWRRRQQLFANISEEEKEEGWRKANLQSKILRLNKTIYGEAIGYLYSDTFIFADTNALHDFLTAIGPRMRGRLREIEVAEWGYSSAHKAMNYPAMSLLSDATNLERIWLNICHWEGTLVQKIFRDCSTFLLAYGFAKGKKDAALDIIHLPSTDDEKRPWQIAKSTRSPGANQKVLEGVRSYIALA